MTLRRGARRWCPSGGARSRAARAQDRRAGRRGDRRRHRDEVPAHRRPPPARGRDGRPLPGEPLVGARGTAAARGPGPDRAQAGTGWRPGRRSGRPGQPRPHGEPLLPPRRRHLRVGAAHAGDARAALRPARVTPLRSAAWRWSRSSARCACARTPRRAATAIASTRRSTGSPTTRSSACSPRRSAASSPTTSSCDATTEARLTAIVDERAALAVADRRRSDRGGQPPDVPPPARPARRPRGRTELLDTLIEWR